MFKAITVTGHGVVTIDQGWELTSTPANFAAAPEDLGNLAWLPAQVPGTAAGALKALDRWQLDSPTPLHDRDHWYRVHFDANGQQTLRFNGLATLAEVWLNGALILRADNMFLGHAVDVSFIGRNELVLCFRALDVRLAQPTPRARWRPQMIVPSSLRTVRTTVLGHMPGWCPPVHVVGPWRAIERIEEPLRARIGDVQVLAQLEGSAKGILQVALKVSEDFKGTGTIECADRIGQMEMGSDGYLRAELAIDKVAPWWPHTHGEARLYEVRVHLNDTVIELGKVGFRRIEIHRGADGRAFALIVNGVQIFCRGACWTSADIVGMADTRAAYEPWLQKMRMANMNMVRVGGTMAYEGTAFYQLCDELGILVWQDFMFANFDYPIADSSFEQSVLQEAAQFLGRTQLSPCLAVLCGGSEVAQQAAMLGLKRELWTSALFDDWLPAAATRVRPDVPYVPNSPHGGELPFVANSGVSHYYGVGAYLRPMDDARRAEVRFASECLAFANVPEQTTLSRTLAVPAVHHPRWKERVPRDNGASWDFEDVRDHYLEQLYRVDAALLRREDPARYLDLSRAVTGEVMETVFAEWRRKRSTCAGGLVWNFQDLWPGAGWGVVDSRGEPKAAWFALRRAFRPVQVVLTDEGINGLALNAVNDGDRNREVRLSLACWNGAALVVSGERVLTLHARETIELAATDLLGVFFDTTYAYRFGPPGHTLVTAALHDVQNDEQIADAYYFPHGRDTKSPPADLKVAVEEHESQWTLSITTDRLAMSVHIEDEAFLPEDNWFHLPPKATRLIRLLPRSAERCVPNGEVRTLNNQRSVRYRVAQ